MRSRATVIGGLVAVVLATTGCGGGSSGLSKADYITQADGICKTAKDEITKLTAPSSAAELKPWLTSVLAATQQEFAALNALKPPSSDKATITSMLAMASQQVPALAKALAKATAGDAEGAVAVIKDPAVQKTQDSASKIAKDYGFRSCGA